jgi:hypothetical protein
VNIRKEKDGMQLYMVCPECLQKDGKKALLDRKLAVNATRLFGMGHYAMRVGQYSADWSGYCMKQSKGFSVAELRAWAPLKDRGFPDVPQGVTKPAPGRCLIPDGKGNMIPDHPGEVIPLTELPDDHPAVHYLKSRRFDIQFRANLIATCRRLTMALKFTPSIRPPSGRHLLRCTAAHRKRFPKPLAASVCVRRRSTSSRVMCPMMDMCAPVAQPGLFFVRVRKVPPSHA